MTATLDGRSANVSSAGRQGSHVAGPRALARRLEATVQLAARVGLGIGNRCASERLRAGDFAGPRRCMHNACMTSITIRDVPDEVRDELAARARLSGRSLQEYLRSELTELAGRPDPAVLMGQVRERTRHTGSRLSAAQILAHRDHDRR